MIRSSKEPGLIVNDAAGFALDFNFDDVETKFCRKGMSRASWSPAKFLQMTNPTTFHQRTLSSGAAAWVGRIPKIQWEVTSSRAVPGSVSRLEA
jgi:hypothetical protein